MKIYTKILITTLPMVFFFLVTMGGISYYFSHRALTVLAEEWLTTRTSEAMEVVRKHEKILYQYELEHIPASRVKAKLDAIKKISGIKIWKKGYFLVVDGRGTVVFHPDKSYAGMDISATIWFKQLKEKKNLFLTTKGKKPLANYNFFIEWNWPPQTAVSETKHLRLTVQDEKCLAVCDFFTQWDWFILAVDPEKELYGFSNQMRPYLLSLGVSAAIIISLVLMFLARNLTKPLESLVQGAERIGKGELDTPILIQTHDEFGNLAKEFNRMTARLKKTLTALKGSSLELEHRVEERTRVLSLLNQTLSNEIQDRKNKEAELKKANQARNEFLANISHEIRTPLNSIIGFSEILSTMIRKNEEHSYLNAIRTAGRNLLSLINDILDLSKMEADKFKINKGIVDIHMVIDDIYHLFKTRIEKKSLVFIRDLDDKLPPYLFVDGTRLQQVLVNLIDNAVKFTDKGHIRLRIQLIKTHPDTSKIDLAISIEDSGIGIPEDKLNIIFDSFVQSSSNISRAYGGTGLGLSICKNLVELMGGEIKVKSNEGRGTVFNLVLPGIEISHHTPETGEKAPADIQKFSNLLPDMAYPEGEPENPNFGLSIEVLKKYCLDNNTLKKQIDSKIFQLLPEFQEGIKIEDIKILIENIICIGKTFKIPELTKFGHKLSQYAQAFDIERLNIGLQQLYDISKRTVYIGPLM
jgi:signal transduction histidine kinase